MKIFSTICLLLISVQSLLAQTTNRDTLIKIEADPAKGFHYSYYLSIPKGTLTGNKIHLMVEPNNTGRVSDDLSVHDQAAKIQAGKHSLALPIARELQVPLLVPVFPRPETNWIIYTHALDRDVMLVKEGPLKRLDLQLLAMVADAAGQLNKLNIPIHEKLLLNGFSASGTFVNRFSMLHPERVAALAAGGINAIAIVPARTSGNVALEYPLGLADFKERFGKKPNFKAFRKVPQFLYMGAKDDNDAAQFADGYSPEEKMIIESRFGKTLVPERWSAMEAAYKQARVPAVFKTYPHIGHGTNQLIHKELVEFFRTHSRNTRN